MACILVIDDEPELRKVLRDILIQAGYEVVEAGDGREGLQQCQERPIDVVITDILMPVHAGFEMIRTLRTLAPAVKIIAMSGGGPLRNLNLLTVATQVGAHRVLPKPMRVMDLLEAVQTLLAEP